jgi:hypothetical protein
LAHVKGLKVLVHAKKEDTKNSSQRLVVNHVDPFQVEPAVVAHIGGVVIVLSSVGRGDPHQLRLRPKKRALDLCHVGLIVLGGAKRLEQSPLLVSQVGASPSSSSEA